jgi:hypothetical protein
MHAKSTGKIGQHNRQDRVARLLFPLTFYPYSIAYIFLVSPSSLAISFVPVLTNERLSFICKHGNNRYCHAGIAGQKKSRRYNKKKVEDTTGTATLEALPLT